jgi:hypothetical protein
MASNLAEMAIRKKISAMSDAYYFDARSFGEKAWQAFSDRNKSQINNLEGIANSATRVPDILDYIKRQTGRSKPQKSWRYQNYGEELLGILDNKLRLDAQSIYDEIKRAIKDHKMEDDDRRRIHLLLCRELIRHLSAHYLYRTGSEAISSPR